MLIETPYKEGDTVSLKLNSGEELVARLEKEEDTFYLLHKPMALIAQQQGLGLAPFMFSVAPDSKFKIQKNSVMCILKTVEGLSKEYTAQTTGIQMV
jgi:hypothetical protein